MRSEIHNRERQEEVRDSAGQSLSNEESIVLTNNGSADSVASIKIPFNLFVKEEKNLKELAEFAWWKSQFRNSVIYNFTVKGLSNRTRANGQRRFPKSQGYIKKWSETFIAN